MKKCLMILLSVCGAWFAGGCGSGGSSGPKQDVATHFSVMAATATPTVGTPFNITVNALDAAGQQVATYSGTLHFTSSSGQAVQPASGSITGGSGTFSVTLTTTGNQTITASDTASLTGTSSMLAVGVTVASQFSVSAPATATAGSAFSFTVTARDVSNSVVTTYSGTVHFTSSDPQAVLPANATLTNGTGTFSITLKTANGETITATDTATASLTGTSSGINVASGPATHLIINAPATASAGQIITFGVSAQDTYGNVATGYTGTVHFATNDAQAVPPANTTLTGGGGGQAFSIALKTIQSTTITATDTVTASITGSSSPITVTSNAVTHLSFAPFTNATTRTRSDFVVYALDALNNISIGYSGTVNFTSTDVQASFLSNPQTFGNGTAFMAITFETPGSQTITAKDTATASLTATSNAITVAAASTPSITSGAPPNGAFGVNYGPSKTEAFLCRSPLNCTTPCDSANSNCAGYRSCRSSTYPCTISKSIFDGFTFTAQGGLRPYVWSATGLPPGLSIANTFAANGEFIGTPTSAGTFNISVTVTDSGKPAVSSPASNYTIVIKDPPPPFINATPVPPNGAVNLPYSFTFTAASAAKPFTWRVSVGTLPAGLTLNPDGLLSGTPTTVGTTSITVIATDEFKQDSAPQVFSIQIFAHGFEATGSLATARAAATATLLNTGKVLVAGGTSTGSDALSSAELYDSTSKTFSATGSMAAGRHHFAATLLPSGKVLVTGGLDSTGNPLASAELYDPVAGTFSPTAAPMQFVHASHTATLLNTGKVLVAGWGNAIAELFDPATNTFTQTGSMVTGRVSHTATLLKNGKVLITGGIQGAPPNTTVLAEAELYDPGSGSFSATLQPMATPRQWHTATLLSDGSTVLVTGGLDGFNDRLASAELFDLATQSFTAPKGNMNSPRAFQTATQLTDGTVLITGGNDENTSTLSTAEVYDPTAGTFSPTGGMVSARQSHTATLLNDGTVLLAGGISGAVLASAELYK
jgi:hypothetical protein